MLCHLQAGVMGEGSSKPAGSYFLDWVIAEKVVCEQEAAQEMSVHNNMPDCEETGPLLSWKMKA